MALFYGEIMNKTWFFMLASERLMDVCGGQWLRVTIPSAIVKED
jgi:hypothetical protein